MTREAISQPGDSTSPHRVTSVMQRATSRFGSLGRNSSLIMATTIVNALLGYLFWLASARLFPTVEVGFAAAAIVLMNLASVITTFGLSSLLVQHLPSSPDHHWSALVNTALRFVLVTSAIGGLVTLVVIQRSGVVLGSAASVVLWGGVVIIGVAAWSASMVVDATLVAERHGGLLLARNSVFGVLRVAAVGIVAAFGARGSLALCGAWSVAGVGSLLFATVVLRPRIKRSFSSSARLDGLLGYLRHAWLHFLAELGGQLPMYLLPVLVVVRVSAEADAWFYIAWMMSTAFFMVSDGVGRAMFAEGMATGVHIVRLTVRAAAGVTVLLVPVILAALVFGRTVLGLFGPDYAAKGYPLVVLLAASAPFDAITNLWVSSQRVRGRLKAVAAVMLTMAAIVLVGSWAALPHLGILAVGWAWLGAQACGSILVTLDVSARALRRRGHREVRRHEPGFAPGRLSTAAP